MEKIVAQTTAQKVLSEATGENIGTVKVKQLMKFNLLRCNDKGRITAESLEELAERPIYETLPAKEVLNTRAFVAVAISGENLDHSLVLSEKNSRDEALNELKRRGRSLAPQEELSSWWQIEELKLEHLIAENAVLLGVIGGYVIEAARIIEPVIRTDFNNLVSLIIEPITGKELEQYLGYVPGVRLGTRYARPLTSTQGV